MLDLKSQLRPVKPYVRQYEIYDDWDDSRLTDRRVTVEAFRCKEQSNFRPEWTTESGSPSASGGELVLPAGDTTVQIVDAPSSFDTGTWEVDLLEHTASTGAVVFRLIFQDADNWWSGWWRLYEGYQKLVKDDAGTVTAVIDTGTGVIADDGTYHTYKYTRDSDGNWEMFQDGSSLGTATDTFLPTANKLRFRNWEDAEVDFDNLKVY